MNCGSFHTLGSIEAVRPVFLIVMGVFLCLIGWRLAKTSGAWTGRCLMAGGLLLGFGYSVLLPMYEAGAIESFRPGAGQDAASASAVAWHVVKLVVMNTGWLMLGLGLAMHAKLFGEPAPRPLAQPQTASSPHESIA